jgi:hypothetical protein
MTPSTHDSFIHGKGKRTTNDVFFSQNRKEEKMIVGKVWRDQRKLR